MIPGFLTAVKSVCGLWFVVKNSKTTNYFLRLAFTPGRAINLSGGIAGIAGG